MWQLLMACICSSLSLSVHVLTVSPWQPKWHCQSLQPRKRRVVGGDLGFDKCTQLHPSPSFCLHPSIPLASNLYPPTATAASACWTGRELELVPSSSKTATKRLLPLTPTQAWLCVKWDTKKRCPTVRQEGYWDRKQEEQVPPLSFSNWGVMVSGTSDWSMSFSLEIMCFTKQFAASSMLMFSWKQDKDEYMKKIYRENIGFFNKMSMV